MEEKTILSFYMNDHRRLDDLWKESRDVATKDPDKALALFRQFREGLERHIIWEEDILFPLFERKTGMRQIGPTAVMRREHAEIRDLLAQLENIFERSQDPQELGILLENLLTSHNWKEENMLYPAIDHQVTIEERQQVYGKMGLADVAK